MPEQSSRGHGEPHFVVLPDCGTALAVAQRVKVLGARTLNHASGRPWLAGRWRDDEITVAAAGDVRLAVIGWCPVGVAELERATAGLRDLARLDDLARRLPGSFHLVASLGGRCRVQGTASGLRLVFYRRVVGAVVAADRADVLAGDLPFWGRAMGWYAITCCDVLEDLPRTHPDRPKLISILGRLIAALAQHQDRRTGRWFQVVDKGSNPENWTETSCSSMYSMAISRAVERGYVSRKYDIVAQRGYRGVLDRVSINAQGLTEISEICIGTNVGDLPFYLARPRAVNDLHGIGAFLIMSEQFQRR